MNQEFETQYRSYLSLELRELNRRMLKNKDVSIISPNCIGGSMAHYLGLQHNSPTVDSAFYTEDDFLRFLGDIHHYLSVPIKEAEPYYHEKLKRFIPRGSMDDIVLLFQHDQTFQQVEVKWNRRRLRVSQDNLFVVASFGLEVSTAFRKGFHALPHEHKCLFVPKEVRYPSEFAVEQEKAWTNSSSLVGIMDDLGRRWFDLFDYVNWFNTGEKRKSNPTKASTKARAFFNAATHRS